MYCCVAQISDTFEGIDVRINIDFLDFLQKSLNDTRYAAHAACAPLLRRLIRLTADNGQADSMSWSYNDIFYWHSSASAALEDSWSRFFLIYNTMVDHSTHLIRPMFTTMDALFPRVDWNGSQTVATFPLHFSWLAVLYQSGFNHANFNVCQQVILHVLNYDFSAHPPAYMPAEFVFGSSFRFLLVPAQVFCSACV